jgi:hypothetical protein
MTCGSHDVRLAVDLPATGPIFFFPVMAASFWITGRKRFKRATTASAVTLARA